MMDYFIRAEFLTEARGNPIRLISLLISLFILSLQKEREKRNYFPHEKRTKRTKKNDTKTGRGGGGNRVEKPLYLDFDNRTKIEPVIKRFISSRPYRTISPTPTTDTLFDPFRRPWLVPWEEKIK